MVQSSQTGEVKRYTTYVGLLSLFYGDIQSVSSGSSCASLKIQVLCYSGTIVPTGTLAMQDTSQGSTACHLWPKSSRAMLSSAQSKLPSPVEEEEWEEEEGEGRGLRELKKEEEDDYGNETPRSPTGRRSFTKNFRLSFCCFLLALLPQELFALKHCCVTLSKVCVCVCV